MEVHTIGFAKTRAAEFFGKLKHAAVRRLVDVRLNNVSQLAGYAKRDDLQYFLSEICQVEYIHEPLLAPSREILDAYRKQDGSWDDFECRFLRLMAERGIERAISPGLFDVPSVLLCSEHSPDRCHRRLILEYLDRTWGNVRGIHL